MGSVVSTQKDPSLVGKKLMIVRQVTSDCQMIGREEVAVDYVNAGIGEYVLIVRGGAARAAAKGVSKAAGDVADAAIVGIIDRFDKWL